MSHQLQPIAKLRLIMEKLRSPTGCPWDREQNHESLIPHLLEEAYEVIEAIKKGDREHMKEELGDLLLQVVFHSQLAAERGEFTFDEVTRGIIDKLVRRHPHVFGDTEIKDAPGVLRQWEEIKKKEKKQSTEKFLETIPKSFPALLRAEKIQKKVARVGFDWECSQDVLEKVKEELAEVAHALKEGNREEVSEELGDLLFTVVNLARKENLQAESLLMQANEKFTKRFHLLEKHLKESGEKLEEVGLERLEEIWQRVKSEE